MRIGVDVGGTNTDAVLMDGLRVVASLKSPTTGKVEDGIVRAISGVLAKGKADPARITAVSIGTTHFTNAFVERRHLDRVGILRVALPTMGALPPLTDWPSDVASAVGADVVMVRGGYQYDGSINCNMDEAAVTRAAQSFRAQGINSVAVSVSFSPVNDAMEEQAREIIQSEHPDCEITLSARIGRIGLMERENAGVMNASLATLARETVDGFKAALRELGMRAPFYISQNDGTLMSPDFTRKYPVLTFASGPTNSMRGAAFLSGYKDTLVADIGGTTTDIGVLTNGVPRESAVMTDIGGTRTNFRMPDILAIGLGGGSRVIPGDGKVRIGPESVGHQIMQDAMVFGGETLTATDIAVAAGYADVGDRDRVAKLDKKMVDAAVDEIHRLVEDGVDRMKTSGDAVPLVLVGGGAILINRDLKGISEVVTDETAGGVANAIGASIAQAGGEIDRVYSYDTLGRDTAIQEASDEARLRAVAAGAREDSIEIVEIEELPLAYVEGGAVRLRVKAVGDLAIAGSI